MVHHEKHVEMPSLEETISAEVKLALQHISSLKIGRRQMINNDMAIRLFLLPQSELNSLYAELCALVKKYNADAKIFIMDIENCATVHDLTALALESISD